MAMSRARIAISESCKRIHRISVRRFNAGAEQTSRGSTNSSFESVARVLAPIPLGRVCFTITLFAYWRQLVSENRKLDEKFEIQRQYYEKVDEARNIRMRKMLERIGASRESCEANIAKIKQKIESGTASQDERYDLEKYEGWLEVFTEGLSDQRLTINDKLISHLTND